MAATSVFAWQSVSSPPTSSTSLLIERDQARGEGIAAKLRLTLAFDCDGTDLELLQSEDIGRSDVLVSVIDNDERNLFASLLARQLGVRRVITRVSRLANLRLFEGVGIDVAISARGAAVASVLHQIQGGATRLLAVVEQGAGRILELDVPDTYRPLGAARSGSTREQHCWRHHQGIAGACASRDRSDRTRGPPDRVHHRCCGRPRARLLHRREGVSRALVGRRSHDGHARRLIWSITARASGDRGRLCGVA